MVFSLTLSKLVSRLSRGTLRAQRFRSYNVKNINSNFKRFRPTNLKGMPIGACVQTVLSIFFFFFFCFLIHSLFFAQTTRRNREKLPLFHTVAINSRLIAEYLREYSVSPETSTIQARRF